MSSLSIIGHIGIHYTNIPRTLHIGIGLISLQIFGYFAYLTTMTSGDFQKKDTQTVASLSTKLISMELTGAGYH